MKEVLLDGENYTISDSLARQIREYSPPLTLDAIILEAQSKKNYNHSTSYIKRGTKDTNTIVFELPICCNEWTIATYDLVIQLYNKYKNDKNVSQCWIVHDYYLDRPNREIGLKILFN